MNDNASAAATSVLGRDHVSGPPDAPVTLIEYGDFQCPTCQQAALVVDLLLAQFGSQVRFVFRHFPLESLHPQALQAAEAAECAADQGRFWEMHRLLMENQQRLKMTDLERYASHLGLDMVRFKAGMAGHVHVPRIRADMDMGRESQVRSTPGFFVNGRTLDVSFGMQSLRDAIQKVVGHQGR